MNISCLICLDSISSSSSIATASPCGHCFHSDCLQRWLSTSRTCPQCRSSCTQSNRIYLNIVEAGNTRSSTNNSSNFNSLRNQMTNKDMKIRNLETEMDVLKLQLRDKDSKINNMEIIDAQEGLLRTSQKELKMLSTMNHRLQKEKQELQKKIENMKAEFL